MNMSNQELSEAIEAAWKRMRGTAAYEETYNESRDHYYELLRIQKYRAGAVEYANLPRAL